MSSGIAILAAATSEPSVGIRAKSHLLARDPLVKAVLQSQPVIQRWVCFTASQLWRAASLSAWMTTVMLINLSWAWNSKTVRKLRKKLVFEFMVGVLGPGGNMMVLMVFWPGWVIIAFGVWALRAWWV